MSSLISYGIGTDPDAASDPEAPTEIQNNGFWPAIEPENFITAERIDSSVTAARVEQELRIAIGDINRQLSDFQAKKVAAGYATIDDVPHPVWATESHYTTLYLRAVYATARASLMERYRDISATGAGDALGQAKNESADDYRRDARWAVSEIEGRTHSTVELI
ncbi:MAG: head completion/stabilization protein [Moraxellaceae bacterium]|nr:head completion/stabilization protein [Moraxellaceae bacterium]